MWNILYFVGLPLKEPIKQLKKTSEIWFISVAILKLKLVIMIHPNQVRYKLQLSFL